MEQEEVIIKSFHPKEEGDEKAADCRRVEKVPRIVEDVSVSFRERKGSQIDHVNRSRPGI